MKYSFSANHLPPSMVCYSHQHSHQSLFRLLNTTDGAGQGRIREIHAQIIRLGHGRDSALLTSLLRHYTSYTPLPPASTAVFSQFPTTPSAFAWNLMIRAHTISGDPFVAVLIYFNRMVVLGVPIDNFTLPFAIRACSGISHLGKGKEVHGFAIKTGFYDDVFLHNGIAHFYLKCGDVESVRLLFDRMPVKNVVSWTTVVSGLVSLGELEEARELFDAMPARNVVSWTAMIDGYAKHGRPQDAVEMFRSMLMTDVKPNEFTFVGLLIACAELGSLGLGRWAHNFARKYTNSDGHEFDIDIFVGTALIDMYSNVGSLEDAVKVFDKMPVKSLATWNSMITSLGMHGRGREAVDLFQRMEKEGNVTPDEITFKAVMCGCLRDGLVGEGCKMFESMIEKYSIEPSADHWSCLAQLLDVEDANQIRLLAEDQRFRREGKKWKKLMEVFMVDRGGAELQNLVAKNTFYL